MTDFFWLLADDIVRITVFAVLCAYPFMGSFRFSNKKTAFLTLLVIFAVSVIDSAISVYISFTIPEEEPISVQLDMVFYVIMIFCMAWYLYTVRAVWQKKAFIFLFSLTSALFIMSIANCVLELLPVEAKRITAGLHTILSTLSAGAITVPLLCLFLKLFYMPVEKRMGAKECGYLCIPLLILLMIFVIVFTFMDYVDLVADPTSFLLYFGLLLSAFVLYGVIFRMYRLAYERYASNEKYLETKHQIDIRDEQYRRISENIENVRRQRHDIRHHMVLLCELLEKDEKEKAILYLKQYLEHSETRSITKYCDNPVINLLASHYGDMAKERDILFNAHIQVPGSLPIQDIDLSVLLGNLLENALDAAQSALGEKRMIKLNMICSGKMLAVTVDNGFNGTVKKSGEKYLSTKSEHRGLGLSSLSDIAAKYGGGADFRNEENVFYSSVMLSLDNTHGEKKQST